jgi:hypothetical protein
MRAKFLALYREIELMGPATARNSSSLERVIRQGKNPVLCSDSAVLLISNESKLH